jgi:hypothetical protein
VARRSRPNFLAGSPITHGDGTLPPVSAQGQKVSVFHVTCWPVLDQPPRTSEPPIGIEPMTYALRGCSRALVTGVQCPRQLQVHELLLVAIIGY